MSEFQETLLQGFFRQEWILAVGSFLIGSIIMSVLFQ